MIRRFSLFLILFTFCFTLSGQEKKSATDLYVDYTNESIHGILIVHRLLQNYNKEINKYVDLESTQLNFFSNSDLALDIFSSESFFSPTPEMIYAEAIKETGASTQIKQNAKAIRSICKELNQLRFDIENSINDYDLNKPENLGRVYQQLKRGEDLYDAYFAQYKSLHSRLALIDAKYSKSISKDLHTLYTGMWSILIAMRGDDSKPKLGSKRDALVSAIANIAKVKSSQNQKNLDKIVDTAEKFVEIVDAYASGIQIPVEYKQYGRNYFYYNTEAITKFNWYGQGVVREINIILENTEPDAPRLLEIPHYFKVVYPKRKEKIGALKQVKPALAKEKSVIKGSKVIELPTEIKDRRVRKGSKTLKSSELELELEIYDHMIEDGDIISLQFNDVWIVEKEPLRKKPIHRTIRIDPNSKNYVLLHAENVGSRPPNTIAIRYKYFGSYKQVVLNSDLNTSELIEIEYVR